MSHLILYDGDCPLCNRAIRVILSHDKKDKFLFSSLQGETAHKVLGGSSLLEPPYESMVLIENFGRNHEKIYSFSKASFKIAWYLGGKFLWLGILAFLPRVLFDPVYKWVARRRHKVFNQTVKVDPKAYEGKFLP